MSALSETLFFRSFFLQAGFSDERRQGLGFAWTIDPALSAAYGADAAGLRDARLRQLASFNAQPSAAGLIVGACAALEARAAGGDAGAVARAESFKTSIAAALSGSADAVFWGALRPLAAAAAVLAAVVGVRRGAASPFAVGAALGLLAFNLPALAARRAGLARGLSDADAAVRAFAALPLRRWLRAARLAAAALIFAAAAGMLTSPRLGVSAAVAAAAFAFGAGATRAGTGVLKLVAAAGLLGAAASAAVGWAP